PCAAQARTSTCGNPAFSIYWRAMIPFLHVFGITIPTYGISVASAMLAAYFLLRAGLARRGIASNPKEGSAPDAESLIALPCLAGIAGAKLYHVLETPRDFFADPVHQIFSQFGFAWFGGMLAGVAAFVWLARGIAQRSSAAGGQKITLLDLLDAGSPAAALGYGLGRIGCFLSGDGDYGIPTSLPWGMSFPHGLVPTTQRVHPTPIYELIVGCLIAWLLWRMGARQWRARFSTDAPAPAGTSGSPAGLPSVAPGDGLWLSAGAVFAAYLILTGLARFLVEFIRINPRSFLGMSNAQAASIVSVAAGIILIWKLRRARAPRANG
ncbi:MAG: prolipoprotein diacylglyceryl transferase, partial [Candidatus Acidiferrales bacterium]